MDKQRDQKKAVAKRKLAELLWSHKPCAKTISNLNQRQKDGLQAASEAMEKCNEVMEAMRMIQGKYSEAMEQMQTTQGYLYRVLNTLQNPNNTLQSRTTPYIDQSQPNSTTMLRHPPAQPTPQPTPRPSQQAHYPAGDFNLPYASQPNHPMGSNTHIQQPYTQPTPQHPHYPHSESPVLSTNNLMPMQNSFPQYPNQESAAGEVMEEDNLDFFRDTDLLDMLNAN
ncbi:hypothetical protein MAP00_007619 [Monascus purpureus]|nr:hypothetical protein MAP00_007619 [Monascus purpureus]